MAWDWEKLREKQEQYKKNTQGSGFGEGGGGGITPPDFDKLKARFNKFKITGVLFVVLILLALFFGSSTFYTVAVDEVGVVQRFGKYIRMSGPGLNFKLPAGIEKVTFVKVKRVYKEELGFKAIRTGSDSAPISKENLNESLMLTGDLNVAIVPWIVQYRIKDAYKFLFKVKNVNKLLRDMAEATMRSVVGDRGINEVISKREEIAVEARLLLQKELDEAEAGINVVTIEMKKTNVPDSVQPSFNEVNQAIQEKEKLIYKAKEDYNKAIPAAEGEASRVVEVSKGYALDKVNRAKGDAKRFVSVYNEYKKAKDVTRRRIYLETIKEVFPKIGHKYIIDPNQKGVLPLLNLKENDILKIKK